MVKPGSTTVTKRDWLLLFLSVPHGPKETPSEVDPIRIQKGMFLFAKEAGARSSQKYQFRPYNYGACSFEIYKDLDALVAENMLEKVEVPWQSWATFRPTEKGMAAARKARQIVSPVLFDKLDSIKKFVFSRGFFDLLREIYKKYPDFAVNSVLKFKD